MRRTAPFVALWFLVGVAAVSAATVAVSMVGRQVTGDRPAPLSAAEVRAELAAGDADRDAAPTAGDGSVDPRSTSTEPTRTTAPAVPDTGQPSPPVTSPEPVTTVPADGGPPTTAPVTTVSSDATETRTYALVGGTATLRFTTAGVTVLAATPNAGFSVKTEPEHGNGVKVEFESGSHRSRVSAWWDGAPRDEVREDDR